MQNMINNLNIITELVKAGIDLTYNELSLCNIKNRLYTKNRRKTYQIFCDSFLLKFADEYDNVEICVDKFIALKNELDRKKKEYARNIKLKEKSGELSNVSAVEQDA